MKMSLGILAFAGVGILTQTASATMPILPDLKQLAVKAEATKTPADKAQVAQNLAAKQSAMKELSSKASKVQADMAQILAKPDALKTQEGIELMKSLMEQLADINEKVAKLAEDVEFLKGWVEGQQENLPIIEGEVSMLKNFKPANYMQFQYVADSRPRNKDNFEFRRIRFGTTYVVDPKTSVKVSFDGGVSNDQNAFQLRDAMLTYDIVPSTDIVGMTFNAGQFALPLGYELARSSSDREFPERAAYNRVMFNGERIRGAMFTGGIGKNALGYIGVGTSLTNADPEQNGKNPVRDNAIFLGARYYNSNLDLGLGYLTGQRPGYSATHGAAAVNQNVDRRFLMFDISYVGLIVPQLTARFEYLTGSDRVPSTTAGNRPATDMMGYHLLLSYQLDPRNVFFTRIEMFDPNTSKSAAPNSQSSYGIGYRYFINPGASVTLATEWFKDQAQALGTSKSFRTTTLRYQFRF